MESVILVYLVVLMAVLLIGIYIRRRLKATPYQEDFSEAESGEIFTEEK